MQRPSTRHFAVDLDALTLVADYSRTLMLMSRAYLEGNDIFQEQASSRHGVLIDPRVSKPKFGKIYARFALGL
jgi:hypothetical protein